MIWGLKLIQTSLNPAISGPLPLKRDKRSGIKIRVRYLIKLIFQ